jgi:single-strand selective monofunctional uracil DNA glycosylase
VKEQAPVFEACNHALRAMIDCLEPKHVIGVGAFAEKRARVALDGLDIPVGHILHPSPASPAANRGWADAAEKSLSSYGITW